MYQNARQYNLTGLGIDGHHNVVIVEGGPKGIDKYKKLMLGRIDWSLADPTNKCTLVWEGKVRQRHFGGFKIKPFKDEFEIQETLGECMHYYTAAKNHAEQVF